jgi:hypothetical protein
MSDLDQLNQDIATLPATAQELVVDFVNVLKQRYASPSFTQTLDLENEPFVGMWSDRPEMQDSIAWVKRIRQQHWQK